MSDVDVYEACARVALSLSRDYYDAIASLEEAADGYRPRSEQRINLRKTIAALRRLHRNGQL